MFNATFNTLFFTALAVGSVLASVEGFKLIGKRWWDKNDPKDLFKVVGHLYGILVVGLATFYLFVEFLRFIKH